MTAQHVSARATPVGHAFRIQTAQGESPIRTHTNRSRFFEKYLQHLHNRYREEGRAHIDCIPTPTRTHDDGNGVTWVPIQEGIVDFVGVLSGAQSGATSGGRA
jgi:hypothetical protein